MKLNYFIRYIFIFVCVVFAVSCAEMAHVGKKAQYPASVTPEWQAEFGQVESQYRARQYDTAFAGYESFVVSHPYTELTDEALYKQGKIYFLTKRYQDAAAKFSELEHKSPNPVYQAKGGHMAAYSYFKLNQFDAAVKSLKGVADESLPANLRAQYYSLAIEATKQSSVDLDFGDFAKLKLLHLYEEYAGSGLGNIHGAAVIGYPEVRVMVLAWMDTPMTPAEIPAWTKKFPEGAGRLYVDFKLAKVYFDANDKRARKILSQFVSKYQRSSYFEPAKKMLAQLGGPEPVLKDKSQYAIGVLVPLSGPYESYGHAVLDGVRCATGEDNACEEKGGARLVVRDSGLTPESIRYAVDELANENVVAIIGPLSGDLAIEAGIQASSKKIPIFPITQKSGLMGQGDYIFQVGLLPEQQIRSLVSAARERGLKNFGVFYPNNNYGQTMYRLFVEQVKAQGGRIIAQAEYNKTSHDALSEVRKLKMSVGASGDDTIGIDSLFIPDSYQTINVLAGSLASMGIKGIALLGTNAWNDPGLNTGIAAQFPKSFFIDLYDGAAGDKKIDDFKQKFTVSFGRDPRVLEAYGFDIGMMIRDLVASKGKGGVKEGLDSGGSFSGVTGLKGFTHGEGPVVNSFVLKVGGAPGADWQ